VFIDFVKVEWIVVEGTTKGKSLGGSLLQSREDRTLYAILQALGKMTSYYPQTDECRQNKTVTCLCTPLAASSFGKIFKIFHRDASRQQ
jgi:hypothetical protein